MEIVTLICRLFFFLEDDVDNPDPGRFSRDSTQIPVKKTKSLKERKIWKVWKLDHISEFKYKEDKHRLTS